MTSGHCTALKENSSLTLQVSDGIFQRLEKCVVMMARGMSVQQAKDALLSDVETSFVAAGLLDDTPEQKPGLKASSTMVASFSVSISAALYGLCICHNMRCSCPHVRLTLLICMPCVCGTGCQRAHQATHQQVDTSVWRRRQSREIEHHCCRIPATGSTARLASKSLSCSKTSCISYCERLPCIGHRTAFAQH